MMKKMNKKAFTLIELLVVIAVVGILVLLAAPRFTGYTQKAELIRIQHDTKVMEEEVGTVLINGDDDFNKWKNNSKDLNQLVQEDKLFDKEGPVVPKDGEPIGGQPYKVIPEKYKDKINTKLKGTFYANKDGKVYYEHGKGPGYSDEEIDDLVYRHEHIPVATAEELDSIRNGTTRIYGEGTKWRGTYTGGLDKHYVQVKNIDLSEYSGEGWNPIGTYVDFDNSSPFTGTYDGGDYVITNLDVKWEGEGYQGLFGYTEGATIRNVGLIDSTVTVTATIRPGIMGIPFGAGSLVGGARSTTIENSYATGSVTGAKHVGGLVGYAGSDNTISNSYATGSVKGTNQVGGLVGYTIWNSNTGLGTEITNSYATGSVEGVAGVGGLVGDVGRAAKISNSYATGSVTGSGDNVGGLAGYVYWSTIENSHATGPVTGGGDSIGGLVGRTNIDVTISNSYATGPVTGPVDKVIVDYLGGNLRASQYVGGLVGEANYGTKISNSYAKGSVIGGEIVGGLVGYAESSTTKISSSYATGSVTGSGDEVGGFVGYANSSTIENSHATGEVKGSGHYVGGLVGHAGGTKISNSYAEGSVTGARHHVGGLVGSARGITIDNSYATGSVIGGEIVGGLVGQAQNGTTISNSYATGLVEGGGFAGGFVGRVYWSPIKNAYATGSVTTNSYWDISTTGQETSAGEEEGKTTEEMKDKDTYEGWNFDTVWEITPGNYPTLR